MSNGELKPQPQTFEIFANRAKDMFLKITDESTWLREIVFALQTIRGNEVLRKADPESIKNAIVNVAATGTTLNPALMEAYLVPRDGKCCLDFSYRGLIRIATKDGSVKNIAAQVVYIWDEFDYEQGSKPNLHYKMKLEPPEDAIKLIEAEPIKVWDYVTAAFSIATLPDGTMDFIILPKYRLWKVFQSSKGKDNKKMPWHTWAEEQMRKTAIKYHSKTLPRSEHLAQAIQVLNEHEGLAEPISTASRLMEKIKPEQIEETIDDNAPEAEEIFGKEE